MGIRITKTIINELVKIKGDRIWESYRQVDEHNQQDNHIKRWIQLILNQPNQTPAKNESSPRFASGVIEAPGLQDSMINQSVIVAPQSRLDDK